MSTILLVEDDAEIAELTVGRLERAGFEVLVANDRASGIELACAKLPDLILMDVQLSADLRGGLEATRFLKSNSATRKIPILVLSASAMPADREQAFAAGCDELEEKPFDTVRLLEKINALLRKRDEHEVKRT